MGYFEVKRHFDLPTWAALSSHETNKSGDIICWPAGMFLIYVLDKEFIFTPLRVSCQILMDGE